MADLAGQTLADRYDLLELLGSGGMGEVYRARDRELDELVALKVIRSDRMNDELVARFRHEVKLARRVTHGNVARTFELGYAGAVMYCTMELIEGESLTQRIAARGRLPIGEAVAIACSVCDALAAAHAAGVIHRDIKPDNVLLARDGRVVVADFGVAAIAVDGAGELSGTPAYMAPEQALGGLPTPAADVYAVGAVLHEMLTGRRGFLGEPLAILDAKQIAEHLRPTDVPAELADVVARATAREPARRFDSAEALRRALAPWTRASEPILAAAAVIARPTSAPDVQEVLVLAPGDGIDPARRYLAETVHDGILTRLARRPRVRVRPRVEVPPDSDATVVALRPGGELRIVVERRGRTLFALDVPLSIEHIDGAAEAVVAAITATFALESPPSHAARAEALDLVLRAKHELAHDLVRPSETLPPLARAHALAPDEPMVLAALAIAHVRGAFMADDVDSGVFERAAELARRAVAAAPELALSHLAMGHLEIHLGEAVRAAVHFRTALARAPHDAEAHELLGRLLLEAGYLDLALARLEEALAIAPQRASARWEIGRAFALEGRWADYDRLEQELLRGRDATYRLMPRTRVMFWRPGPPPQVPDFVGTAPMTFGKATPPMVISAYHGAPWPPIREALMAALVPQLDRRRNAFVAQLATEIATFRDDLEMASYALAFSVDHGLFDRHWLERCPLLGPLRETAAYAAAHAEVKVRAEGILDALYGDQVLPTIAETVLATTAPPR